jgi:NAD(P)-dependent dehydrogenase (short-subunit alcohol dehydrogenase family)
MSRRFTHDDSLAFARLSGDYNPIHLDPILARRLLFGRTILHGMHLLLGMADQCLSGLTSPLRLTRIVAEFRRPASEGQSIDFAAREHIAGRLREEALFKQISLMTLELQFSPGGPSGIEIPQLESHPTQPQEWSLSEARDRAGHVPLCMDRALAGKLFPNLMRLIPPEQVATLLGMSRLVGMEVPGLNSVLRGLELSDSSNRDEPELTYQVKRVDERFSLVDLQVEAPGLSGTVSAGTRPKPRVQAGYDAIRPLVGSGEFRGERVLVIGGSRGLGETAVKVLAAGGADVRFSYCLGEAEANELGRQITLAGGSAVSFRHDVVEPQGQFKLERALGDWQPTLLGYFATPHIFAGHGGRYSAELFRTFCDFYVNAFYATFASLPTVRRVLYPSTIAIDDPQPNLMEYAAAKAAGESLCRSLAAANPEIRIASPRFGRLNTDQTATLLNIRGADPAGPVLDALRGLFR